MSRALPVLQVPTPSPTPGFDDGLDTPGWLPEFIPTVGYRIAVAIIILAVAYYVSKFARRLLGRRVARRFKRPSVSRTVLRSMQMAILVTAGLAALSVLGLGIGNLALSVGVFSAVVGIILAPIIGSVLSGVFVLTEQPYEIGDMVEIEDTDTRGFIEDITLLYTKIFTLDNTFVVIPNGTIRERDVINYSAEDTRTRVTLDVAVTYESDIPQARRLIESAARRTDGVIEGGPDIRIGSARYPAAPTCYIDTFGDHGVQLRLRYWLREPYRLLAMRSRVQTNIWEALDDADVEIPYPHSHLVFDDTSGELQVAFREGDLPEWRESGATVREPARPPNDVPDQETTPSEPDDPVDEEPGDVDGS